MPAYEVRSIMTGVAGSPWYARHFFDSTIMPTPQGAVDAVAAFWTDLSARIGSGVTITCEPEVGEWSTPTTLTAVTSVTPFSVASAGGTNPLPRTSQALIRWRTSTFNGNRRVLGKTFVPYISEEFNEAGGVPTAAFVAFLTATADELAALGLVISSLALNAFVPVTGGDGWNQWAVLRSRRD